MTPGEYRAAYIQALLTGNLLGIPDPTTSIAFVNIISRSLSDVRTRNQNRYQSSKSRLSRYECLGHNNGYSPLHIFATSRLSENLPTPTIVLSCTYCPRLTAVLALSSIIYTTSFLMQCHVFMTMKAPPGEHKWSWLPTDRRKSNVVYHITSGLRDRPLNEVYITMLIRPKPPCDRLCAGVTYLSV